MINKKSQFKKTEGNQNKVKKTIEKKKNKFKKIKIY